MSKKTIKRQIEDVLFSMELNDELNINDLIIKIWGHNDFLFVGVLMFTFVKQRNLFLKYILTEVLK